MKENEIVPVFSPCPPLSKEEWARVLYELRECIPRLVDSCLDCLFGQQTRHGVFCSKKREYVYMEKCYEMCTDFCKVEDVFDLDLPTPFTEHIHKKRKRRGKK